MKIKPCGMVAMVTPLHENGDLNLEIVSEYLSFQANAGMEGVVVGGTNGEATSLTVAERKSLLEQVVSVKGALRVFAGTGAASVRDAIDLTRHASQCGAEAVLVLPPFYYKNPSAQGVVNYFCAVMDASSVPTLLYSIPHQSAVPITDDILERLVKHPRLAGLKDSQANWDRTLHLINHYPTLSIFVGADELIGKTLVAGGTGNISGTANAFPELVMEVHRRVKQGGDWEYAQQKLSLAKAILLKYPLIAASKSVLHHRGLPEMFVRPPLINLDGETRRRLITELIDAGLLNS